MRQLKIFSTIAILICLTSPSTGFSQIEDHNCDDDHVEDTEGWDPNYDSFEEYFATPHYDDREENACAVLEDTAWNSASSHRAPVWGPFMRNLRGCASDCQPYNYNAYRKSKRSCHNTGRALDVGAFKCGGRIHQAIHGGRYAKIVSCMKGKMRVLYRNGRGVTSGHHDHAHFSIGCSVPGNRNYW